MSKNQIIGYCWANLELTPKENCRKRNEVIARCKLLLWLNYTSIKVHDPSGFDGAKTTQKLVAGTWIRFQIWNVERFFLAVLVRSMVTPVSTNQIKRFRCKDDQKTAILVTNPNFLSLLVWHVDSFLQDRCIRSIEEKLFLRNACCCLLP